jgi:hypothetical protein
MKFCPPRPGKPVLPAWALDKQHPDNHAGTRNYDYSCKDRYHNARRPDTELTFSDLGGDAEFDIASIVIAHEDEFISTFEKATGRRLTAIVGVAVGSVQHTREYEDEDGILPWQIRAAAYERLVERHAYP